MKIYYLISVLVFLISCNTVSDNISLEYYNIANAYFEVENYDKAIEYYVRAVNENTDDLNKIRYNLALAYSESGRYASSIENLNLLLLDDPQNFKVLQSLAYINYLNNDVGRSMELYDLILEEFQFDKIALYNKSLILFENEEYDESIDFLKILYTVDSSLDVVLLMGKIYLLQENWIDYIISFEKSLSENPHSIELLKGLIDSYVRDDLFTRALTYIDRILNIEDFKEKSEYSFKKGSILILELNDIVKGIDSLEQAVEMGFDNQKEIEELLSLSSSLYGNELNRIFSK